MKKKIEKIKTEKNKLLSPFVFNLPQRPFNP